MTERHEHDFYPTPARDTWVFLNKIRPDLLGRGPLVAFEPACGDGGMIRALPPTWEVFGCDIQADLVRKVWLDRPHPRATVWEGDFLASEPEQDLVDLAKHVDIWVTNPPYRDDLPMRFARRMEQLARPGALLVMFVRLAFFSGQVRAPLHIELPSDQHPHPWRPRFRTDTTSAGKYDYAWWVREKGQTTRTWHPVATREQAQAWRVEYEASTGKGSNP